MARRPSLRRVSSRPIPISWYLPAGDLGHDHGGGQALDQDPVLRLALAQRLLGHPAIRHVANEAVVPDERPVGIASRREGAAHPAPGTVLPNDPVLDGRGGLAAQHPLRLLENQRAILLRDHPEPQIRLRREGLAPVSGDTDASRPVPRLHRASLFDPDHVDVVRDGLGEVRKPLLAPEELPPQSLDELRQLLAIEPDRHIVPHGFAFARNGAGVHRQSARPAPWTRQRMFERCPEIVTSKPRGSGRTSGRSGERERPESSACSDVREAVRENPLRCRPAAQ
jgi:hypothetical protein